ncbi:MAG: type II CAAX prenyl endopeptidase Rce1 family protein [Polyangiales bacterium]
MPVGEHVVAAKPQASLSRSWPVSLSGTAAVALFAALTASGALALVFTFRALGGRWQGPEGKALGVLYVMTPMLAAFVVQAGILKQSVRRPLGLSLQGKGWWIASWLLPLVLLLPTVMLGAWVANAAVDLSREGYIALNLQRVDPARQAAFVTQVRQASVSPWLSFVLQGLLAGGSLAAWISLCEEIGWRGFLWHHLPGGFWRKATVSGLLWGLWQIPLVSLGHHYPAHPWLGSSLIVLWSMLATPLLTQLRLQSGSVLAAALFRGTLMALSALPALITTSGDALSIGWTGAGGMLTLALTVPLVAWWRWRARRAAWMTCGAAS